ncbi:MAG: T9SS type A sorting domain-containing protein [Bacteroidetes bacterium]|nr:T9SS type A sorting domain-containing protein [Bacteroidota bacterium]
MSTYPIINCLVADAEGKIFAGTQGDGVFKTTTNGDSWFAINSNLSNMYVYSIALSGSNDIYIGTYAGVFSSTNRGESWSQTSLTTNYVVALVTNTDGHVFAGIHNGGLFRSTDRGMTWTQLSNGLTTVQMRALTIDSANTLFLGTTAGVFRSSDNGENWAAINAGLEDTVVTCITSVRGSHLIAGTGTTVFRMAHAVTSWERSDDGLVATRIPALSASADGFLYAGSWGGVFRSANRGQSWTRSSDGVPSGTVLSTAVDSRGYVYASTSVGVYRSTDTGVHWQQIRDGASCLAVNRDNHIFAGTMIGAYRSTDGGATWSHLTTGTIHSDFHAICISAEGTIYASVGDIIGHNLSALFISTDNGESWTITSLQFLSIFSIAVNGQGTIFAGTSSIYRSTDRGLTWTQTSLGTSASWISALQVNALGHIFAVTDGAGVFRSTNNGESWSEVSQGLDNMRLQSLAIDSSGFLYVGSGGYGVFRSRESTTAIDLPETELPREVVLHHNYPNPFNPTTAIRFELPTSSFVSLKVFDVLGREVATLVSGRLEAGRHSSSWNAGAFSSGMYFYRIVADGYVATKRMLLLK